MPPVVDAKELLQRDGFKSGIIHTACDPCAANKLYIFTVYGEIIVNFIYYMRLASACVCFYLQGTGNFLMAVTFCYKTYVQEVFLK